MNPLANLFLKWYADMIVWLGTFFNLYIFALFDPLFPPLNIFENEKSFLFPEIIYHRLGKHVSTYFWLSLNRDNQIQSCYFCIKNFDTLTPTWPLFLFENAPFYLFLSYIFLISESKTTISHKWRTCAQKCNWKPFLGVFKGPYPQNAPFVKLKNSVFLIRMLESTDSKCQIFCPQ